MSQNNDIYWTDTQQAIERLSGTVVMYDNVPSLIHTIIEGNNFEDGIPRVSLQMSSDGSLKRKTLSSPKFNKFKTLPVLGWFNSSEGNCIHLSRKVIRTRTHGLANNNTKLSSFSRIHEYAITPLERNISNICFDAGFVEANNGSYPALIDILSNILEGTAIAYSPRYAVYRDTLGLRWLYRDLQRIGVFTGSDTLNILSKFAYRTEEIMEDPSFTLKNIREY